MTKQLGKEQEDAINKASKWYYNNEDEQVFTISGGPGTGKTFLVNYLIKKLNLQTHQVRFCTFTGRASLVLWEKGIPATTIHQLIYVSRIKKEYEENNGKIVEVKKFIVSKKDKLNPLIKLIIVDEISMVSEKILNDLKSFGIKILCLGDIDQLPPVAGKSNNLLDEPDIRLKENFRQGNDNMIVQIANHVINGGELEYGRYGNNVIVAPLNLMTPEHLSRVDQVICNTNKRRKEINSMIRTHLGRTNTLPEKGDKLVATFNEWENVTYSPFIGDNLPIVNGLIGTCDEIIRYDEINRITTIDFIPTFDKRAKFKSIKLDSQKFKNYKKFIKRKQDDGISDFEFGYAITIHKSQGSEFKKVAMVIDNSYNKDSRLYQQLIFTGITRATEKLVIFI